jgi:hypothetical protein
MKRFRHTNEELESARQQSLNEELGGITGMQNDSLKRVTQKPKFISKGEEQ